MLIPPYFLQRSIARIEAISVAVSTTEVKYTFRNHSQFTAPYNGIVIVKLMAPPTGTTGTLPVVFDSGNGQRTVANFTAADITTDKVYLFYYDGSNIQKIS